MSTKMQNWADHCSSEDEEEAGERETFLQKSDGHMTHTEGGEPQDADYRDGDSADHHHHHHHHGEPADQGPPKPRTYDDLPTEPPFTAFVGNIAYAVTNPDELADAIMQIASDNNMEIKVVRARIILVDHNNRHSSSNNKSRDDNSNKPRHRGFGYVQVETFEQLKALMQLNDVPGGAMLAGRKLQLDKADHKDNNNNPNPRKHSEIDGSKFRGGRFQQQQGNRDSFQQRGGDRGGGGGDERRSSQKQPQDSSPNAAAVVPAQRPSLLLKPRSKPVEAPANDSNSSVSNIFGGGKARDESEWQSRRKSAPPSSVVKTNTDDGKDTTTAEEKKESQQQEKHGEDVQQRRNSKGGRGDKGGRGERGGRGGGGRGDSGGGSFSSMDRRGSGRGQAHTNGGRGGGGGGGHYNKDKEHHSKERNKSKSKNSNAEGHGGGGGGSGGGSGKEKKPAAAPKMAEPEKPAAPTVVAPPVNKFAALGFDSDSD